MNKKILIVLLAVLLVAAGAVYFFLFRGEPPAVYTQFTPGDYFVTNIKDTNRLMKTAVVLVIDSDKLEAKLKEEQALIRDIIIFILRDQGIEVFQSVTGQEMLRTLIKDSLNERLGEGLQGHVADIWFSEYVMQ